jgi:membrane associated rhomboid family serine protease
MQYYHSPFADPRFFLKANKALLWLIVTNAAAWLVVSMARVLVFLLDSPDERAVGAVADLFALPASTLRFSGQPWTLITYMFLHIDFLHILFNLLWLFWFGKIFLEFLSQKKLVCTYLLGGIAGGLAYLLFYNVFPVFSRNLDISFALGASAAVMAIVTAISFYVPRYTVALFLFGKVRIIYIALVLFVLDFFLIRSENAGGHIAHIGGALYGMGYAFTLRQGIRFSMHGSFWHVFRGKTISQRHNQPKDASRRMTDDEYNAYRLKRQQKIDEILDKISRSGYESLTSEEKEILFRASGRQ